MKNQRGDVVLVLFPNFNLRTAKRRPAPILQRDNLGSGLSQTIVAMISSNLATVLDSEIDSVLGLISNMTAVDGALTYTLELS